MSIYNVDERDSARYTTTLLDQDSDVLPAASLTYLELTLMNVATGDIINGRDAQDVLNTNGCTLSAGGVLVWQMASEDNQFVSARTPPVPYELHVALFRWITNEGTPKTGTHEVQLRVRNVATLPGGSPA